MFLDNTACNLASLNLVKFDDDATGTFDLEAYRHAIRLWTIVLEISVTMAHFPSKEIAQGSYDYRTLGLGYANLGSLLMRAGIAYDSDEGRAIAGALTAILTGYAYAASAEMADVVGTFPKFAENRDQMLRVMNNHRKAAYGVEQSMYDGISHHVVGIDPNACPLDMLAEARGAWDLAVQLGEQHGYRNAQATVLAPTGTIGLLMDCDTTGVEPDFALVKFKKLAGGGYFKIANQSIAPALSRLGYTSQQIERMIEYVVGTMSLHRSPHVNTATLIAKGFTADDIDKVEALLPGVFELGLCVQPVDARRGDDAAARLHARGPVHGPQVQHAEGARLLGCRYPRGERLHLRPPDDRGCTAPARRAPAGVRYRQQERPVRQAVHPPRRPHQDDGGSPAVHLGGDLEDDQHAQRGDGRGHRRVLHAVVGARAQGDGALPGRLEGEPAAVCDVGRWRVRGGIRGVRGGAG